MSRADFSAREFRPWCCLAYRRILPVLSTKLWAEKSYTLQTVSLTAAMVGEIWRGSHPFAPSNEIEHEAEVLEAPGYNSNPGLRSFNASRPVFSCSLAALTSSS